MESDNSDFRWVASLRPENKADTLPFTLSASNTEEGILVDHKLDAHYTKTVSDQQLEQWVGNLLKCGVILASAIILFGGILYLIRHGAEPAQYQVFRGVPAEFRTSTGVVKAMLLGSSRGIIQFGLLVLIATPIFRVAFSLLTFLQRRDFIYTTVTFLVLAGLTYSLIWAH